MEMKAGSKTQVKRRSVLEIKALIKEQAESSVKVKDFCLTHQISRAVFYNWRNKYGNALTRSRFVPLELPVYDAELSTVFAEIEFPQQACVRLFRQVDASWIKALIKP